MKLLTPSDLARVIKNARVERNLTQQDVANAVGITRQSLARLERGNGGTSFDTVLLILNHVGIDLEATTYRRRTTAPDAVATRDAAQAAADALANRVTPSISSGALKALAKQIDFPLPQIDSSLLPKIDGSGIFKQFVANLDTATLASIRASSRRLTDGLSIPGSGLISPPRAARADSPATTEVQADADTNAAGGTG